MLWYVFGLVDSNTLLLVVLESENLLSVIAPSPAEDSTKSLSCRGPDDQGCHPCPLGSGPLDLGGGLEGDKDLRPVDAAI